MQDNRVGLACGDLVDGRLTVSAATPGSPDRVIQQLKAWIDGDTPALLAIDAPLGWPAPLGPALAGHRAGRQLTEQANRLFRRCTDDAVSKIKRPLDVGADHIARTAHQALKILSELADALGRSEIPLAWSPQDPRAVQAIEVYPAATLRACNIEIRGYKDRKTGEKDRRVVLSGLQQHLTLADGLVEGCVSCVDALDAVVCLLAGADFLSGRAAPPPEDKEELIRKEGWIWCREPAGGRERGSDQPGRRGAGG